MASENKKIKIENTIGNKNKKEENARFLPEYQTIDSFTQESLKRINYATKASNAIPSDRKEDWDYYSTFKGFRQVMNVQGNAIQRQILALLKYNNIKVPNPGNNVADTLEMLTESNDQLLERISMNLDEAEGIQKDANPLLVEVSEIGLARISGSWNKNMGKPNHQTVVDLSSNNISNRSPGQVKLLAGKHVVRPQINFRNKIDNSSNPFMPRLKEKPHCKKPLSILIEYDVEDETEFYSHPYLFEIDHLGLLQSQCERSPDSMFLNYKSLSEAQVVYVDTADALNQMILYLKNCSEIGVDVEHHSYRSFLGLTCLIQISTKEKDYIVDPFPLWNDESLTNLNEIFANPNIVKVLHGAVHDVEWVQRDHSLYFVNMFDTHIAAKILGFPRGCLSLAFLLQHYCNVKTDKKFQLADWRIRPLADEMLEYARSDTRHLIKIYHLMKNALIEQGNENNNLLLSVYEQSNDLCRKRYEKPCIRPDTYLTQLRKSKANFNSRQLYAYKELFHWRNKVAREEDESEMYVLPPHMLLKISSELPREMQGIIACCNPVPPFVKQNLHFLHQIVFKAREQPLTSVPDSLNSSYATSDMLSMSSLCSSSLDILANPLKCPLDLSNIQQEQVQDNLDVLLKNKEIKDMSKEKRNVVPCKKQPALDIFSSKEKFTTNVKEDNRINIFLTPFQRLQLLKPYLESLAIKQEVKTEDQRTDNERIRSIKAHFDALTAMTPEEYNSGRYDVSNNDCEGAVLNASEDSESDINNEMLDAYDPDPGKVKALRTGLKSNGKKSRSAHKNKLSNLNENQCQQPSSHNPITSKNKIQAQKRNLDTGEDNYDPERIKSEQVKMESGIDFESADFSQYSCGAKAETSNEFNPWSELNKKRKMNQKGKSSLKGSSKSFHYKKSK